MHNKLSDYIDDVLQLRNLYRRKSNDVTETLKLWQDIRNYSPAELNLVRQLIQHIITVQIDNDEDYWKSKDLSFAGLEVSAGLRIYGNLIKEWVDIGSSNEAIHVGCLLRLDFDLGKLLNPRPKLQTN